MNTKTQIIGNPDLIIVIIAHNWLTSMELDNASLRNRLENLNTSGFIESFAVISKIFVVKTEFFNILDQRKDTTILKMLL